MAEVPLARVAQHEDIKIIWRPFELRPDPVPALEPNGEYIQNAWKNHVLPMAREMGVEMNVPPVQPRTRLAHEAALYAREKGRGPEMANALFKAFFQDGRDIGEVTVLCDVGLEAGLDPVGLREALDQRSMSEQTEQELALGQRYGIDAVPFFIYGGKYASRGLPTEDLIRRTLSRVRAEAGGIQVE